MSQENVEIVRRWLEAVERDDLPAVLACLDPALEWIPLRAVADTNENFEIFEPHFELRDLGDRVLAWGSIHVRGSGSGVEMDIPTGPRGRGAVGVDL